LLDLVKHIFDFVASADDVFMVEFQLDLFLQIGSLGFELVELLDLSFLISARSLPQLRFAFQGVKSFCNIHARSHLRWPTESAGLVFFGVDPPGIQMHDLGADGLKVCSTSKS
jgi:hypothetical protein